MTAEKFGVQWVHSFNDIVRVHGSEYQGDSMPSLTKLSRRPDRVMGRPPCLGGIST